MRKVKGFFFKKGEKDKDDKWRERNEIDNSLKRENRINKK